MAEKHDQTQPDTETGREQPTGADSPTTTRRFRVTRQVKSHPVATHQGQPSDTALPDQPSATAHPGQPSDAAHPGQPSGTVATGPTPVQAGVTPVLSREEREMQELAALGDDADRGTPEQDASLRAGCTSMLRVVGLFFLLMFGSIALTMCTKG